MEIQGSNHEMFVLCTTRVNLGTTLSHGNGTVEKNQKFKVESEIKFDWKFHLSGRVNKKQMKCGEQSKYNGR